MLPKAAELDLAYRTVYLVGGWNGIDEALGILVEGN